MKVCELSAYIFEKSGLKFEAMFEFKFDKSEIFISVVMTK